MALPRTLSSLSFLSILTLLTLAGVSAMERPVINLWPDSPPGGIPDLPPEQDISEPGERLIAGKPIIRLRNVTQPQLTIYKPDPAIDTGTAVIVAPGGGHWILAYDLEGTEICEWLSSIGITGVLLKYRVPGQAWNDEERGRSTVQDSQRAVSLLRARAREFGIDPEKIGMMGFSAGSMGASFAAFYEEKWYEPVDKIDEVSSRPDFVGMIYQGSYYHSDIPIRQDLPPFFIAITHDDADRSINAAELYLALKKADVLAELHIFESGGHGYGMRPSYLPVTDYWPKLMEAWLGRIGMLK